MRFVRPGHSLTAHRVKLHLRRAWGTVTFGRPVRLKERHTYFSDFSRSTDNGGTAAAVPVLCCAEMPPATAGGTRAWVSDLPARPSAGQCPAGRGPGRHHGDRRWPGVTGRRVRGGDRAGAVGVGAPSHQVRPYGPGERAEWQVDDDSLHPPPRVRGAEGATPVRGHGVPVFAEFGVGQDGVAAPGPPAGVAAAIGVGLVPVVTLFPRILLHHPLPAVRAENVYGARQHPSVGRPLVDDACEVADLPVITIPSGDRARGVVHAHYPVTGQDGCDGNQQRRPDDGEPTLGG